MVKNNSKNIVIFSILIIIIIVLSFKILNIEKTTPQKNVVVLKEFYKLSSNELSITNNNYENKIKYDNYLFLGDSITDFYDLEKYYPGLPVVNSGINGNRAYDILKDMKNRVYNYNPTKIFLLIGTNQIHKEEKEKVYDSIIEIIEEIRENRPHAKIYVESIYPVNANLDKNIVKNRDNNKIKYVNSKLEEYCKKDDYLIYIDLYNELKDDDDNLNKKYSDDGLHLNDKGYEIITDIIRKYI